MKRLRLKVLIALAVLAGFVTVTWTVNHRREQQRAAIRERGYESVLADYLVAVRPGMTRLEVETYLHNKGKSFKQLCCVASSRGERVSFSREGYDDLVKIGQEPVPFVCSENNVYVAFEFNPKTDSELSETNNSDTLKRVSIFHYLEGCL